MPRKQKRRKTGVILAVYIPLDLLGQVDAAVQERNKRTRAAHFNRSEWVRRAIIRDLAHRDRSRSKRVSTVPSTAEGVEDLGSPPASVGSVQGPATAPPPALPAGLQAAMPPGAIAG